MRNFAVIASAVLLLGCGLPHSSLPCVEPCAVDDGTSAADGAIEAALGEDGSVLADGALSADATDGSAVEAATDATVTPEASADGEAGGPRCGDGVCGTTEDCERCPADCTTGCVAVCRACESDGDCVEEQRCVPRGCDGRRACHTMRTPIDPAHGCVEVSGLRCDLTRPYHPCTTDAECGAGSSCMSMGSSRVCRPSCTNASQCPSFRSEGVVESCSGNDRHCFLSCQRSGECPFGLVCFPFEGGVYGYCGSLG